jgi:hypothetical protein
MDKISDHITLSEGINSYTAKRMGIKNIPNEYQITNMYILAHKVFEPLRKWVKGPIKINSFFRSIELNEAIGGSSTSQHCEGRAMDIDDTYGCKTNSEMFNYIKEKLDFDQLIWEFGDDEEPDWIHVSYCSSDENRKRCLKAYKENGKTKYKII